MDYQEIIDGLQELYLNRTIRANGEVIHQGDSKFYTKPNGEGELFNPKDTDYTKYTVGKGKDNQRTFRVIKSSVNSAQRKDEEKAIRKLVAPTAAVAPIIAAMVALKENLFDALNVKVSHLTQDQADAVARELSSLYHDASALLERNVKAEKAASTGSTKPSWSFS